MKTAILVDGGFYRKMANYYVGEQTPAESAENLVAYCKNTCVKKIPIQKMLVGKKFMIIQHCIGFFIMIALLWKKTSIIH